MMRWSEYRGDDINGDNVTMFRERWWRDWINPLTYSDGCESCNWCDCETVYILEKRSGVDYVSLGFCDNFDVFILKRLNEFYVDIY
jgi:hypothetical protein